jgi:hypothetical protein
MNNNTDNNAHGVPLHCLVRLARDLKAISGHDVGVTLKQAKRMKPDELAEKIREFGNWHKNHCMAISQQVEQAIFYALDDEANVPDETREHKTL